MIDNFAVAMWLVGAMGLVGRHVWLVLSDPDRAGKREVDALARNTREAQR